MKTKNFFIALLLALIMPMGVTATEYQFTETIGKGRDAITLTYTVNYNNQEKAFITGFTAQLPSSGLNQLGIPELVIPASFKIGTTTYTIIGIYDNAFKDQTIIRKVTFPASIIGIGNSAFEGCTLLTTAIFETTKPLSIGSKAFKGCTQLVGIRIPTSTTTIGEDAFMNCNVNNGGPSVAIIKANTDTEIEAQLLSGQYVKNIILDSGITTIGQGAFKGISNLSSITLPTSLTTIGATAFQGCTSLTSVDIPAKVTSIGNLAFDCANLTQVKVNWYTPLQIASGTDPFPQKATDGHSLVVPFALDYYLDEEYWGQFNSIQSPSTYVDDTGLVYGWVGDGTTHVKVVGWQGWTNPMSVLIEPKLYVGDPQNFNENLVFDVTEIGDEALKDCTLLQDITIPASVTKIGESAFQGSGLFSITLNEGLQQIGLNAFNGCSSLQTVNVPSSVTELGAGAFSTCEALQTAIIQAQITRLLNQTFQHCSSLTSVSLPSTLTEINYLAFFNCTSLPSIAIPENVNIIGSAAFRNCTSLKDVYFQGATPPDVDLEGQGDLFRNENGDGVIDHSTITLHVPFGATEAYRNHTYWSTFHILLPSEINIDFADDAVKAVCVGEQTRWDTNGDGELSLAEAAAVTDLYSFFNHTSITSFDELKYFVGLTTIGDVAFNGCSALTKVTIPEGVTTIGSSAFAFCSVLSEVSMPSTLRTIGYSAFDNTGLADVTIPEGVTSIENSAFEELTGHVTLPSTLVSIGNWAFTNATSVTVSWATPPAESSVNSPFGWNLYNKTLYVPFGRRETYKADSYWGGFGTIKEYGNIPFADDNVKAICVASETGWDTNGDGELSVAEAEAVTSIGQAFGAKAITSFDELKYFTGITTIDNKAFHACSSLVSVTLPKNVTSIGMNAFGSCTALAAIVIPQGVTTISNSAFANCTSLNSVELPWTLETIGSDAFYGTTALERITIPSSVTSMNDAFNGSGLKYVTVYWGGEWTDPIAISENTFTSRYTATLFVPEGTEEEYRAADYWKDFPNIVTKIEFNDPKVKAICVAPATGWDTNHDGELTYDEAAAVTTLGTAFTGNTEIETFGELKYFTGLKWGDVPALTGGDNLHGAFDGCTNLRFVVLPSNIKQIMNFSFRGCTSLTSVFIPSGVSTILDYAFNGCTGLSSIYMPQSLEYIGAYAFDGCTGLRGITFPDKVITFGDQAFNGCTDLMSITVNSSTPGTIYGDPFPTRGNITLTVPAHAAATYQANDYWKWFKNFQEQEPDWTGEFTDANGDVYQYETGYYAQLKRHAESSSRTKFTVLSEITVDGTAYPVRSISENAINASYLTTLTIPASITAVKRDAFSCQPTADGMTLKTIIMQGSVPPTAEGFMSWEDDLASYNAQMEVQQHMNPGLEFTRLSLKDITLKVPAGAKTAYEADNTWNRFTVEEVTPGNGNADGIGGIDINDVLAVIDYILGKTVPETFDPAAADINGDGDITIADAAAVVNAILNQ